MQQSKQLTQPLKPQPLNDTSVVNKLMFGKSSLKVSLVLLGTTGVSACVDNHVGTRYDYNNRQECVRDWGEDECPRQTSATGGYYNGGYFFYRSGYYDRNKVTHAKSVTRGGFGGKSRGGS